MIWQIKNALYKSIGESDILVNATNVGMKPNEKGTMIQDTSVYREDLVVAEIIYNPKETRMMREAKEAGVKCVVGGKRYAPVAWGQRRFICYRPGNAGGRRESKILCRVENKRKIYISWEIWT